ncbi:hypothetical protein SASPL_126480 [Salvia splendens]|uniref:Uncharacterized protein n=1 Tax=Salvia splendens TaxID=180675 RepID=A0A8X8XH37_SALSN|nr:hypothetical protein SASPL_126480 [Salvia splendens]
MDLSLCLVVSDGCGFHCDMVRAVQVHGAGLRCDVRQIHRRSGKGVRSAGDAIFLVAKEVDRIVWAKKDELENKILKHREAPKFAA